MDEAAARLDDSQRCAVPGYSGEGGSPGLSLCGRASHPSLAAWTILVPTRRAARALQEKLLVESGKPALVLPQIRPIGDLDEDVLEAQRPYVGLPDAISDIGRNLSMALIDVWAVENPQLRLAQELAQAPQQTQSWRQASPN